MKDQLSRVTTELHTNSSNVGTLNEKTSELERQLGTEKEELEKRQAELKVSYRKMNNYMSRLMGKPTMWFSNRSDTNRPVQSQKRARSLKFRIKVEEELLYTSSENKGADQLRGYREADLRLCFRICILLVFP